MFDDHANPAAREPHRLSAFSRRGFLGGAAGLAASGLLLGGSRAARAASNQVIVSTWGGDYERFLHEFVEAPLRAKGIQVLPDIGQPPARMTKLLAEKSLKTGQMDVVHLSDTDMFQMRQDGVLARIDYAQVPRGKHIIKQFYDDYSIPHIYSAQVLIYNPQHVMPVPDAFAAMWDAKYKGRVGIQRTAWVIWLQIATIVAGGSPTNYEPGKKLLMELKKNQPRIYPSQESLADGIASADVWLTPDWKARGYLWAKRGLPVKTAVPKEGAIPVTYRAAYAKNAPDPAPSLEYLNAMLEPKAQMDFGEQMGYVPTVTDVKLPADLDSVIGFTEEQRSKFFHVDFAYVAANNNAWLQWWNEEFLA
ncbi:MAG TPA: extracellular solute-binding protein [Candidatus Dormibacteraeota bacterium]|nr:extracellular solute-binding protein [Candidatus Dormibacteraeota bacterium]